MTKYGVVGGKHWEVKKTCPKEQQATRVGFEQDNVPLELMHQTTMVYRLSVGKSLAFHYRPAGFNDQQGVDRLWWEMYVVQRNEISDAAVAYQFSHPAMCSNTTCPYLGDFKLEVGYALVIISVLPSHDFRLVEFTAVPWRWEMFNWNR